MKKQLLMISFLATLSASVQAAEQFYKWVDDKGVTHYSQSPPDDTTKTQAVRVSTRLPVGSEAAISNLAKQRAEVTKTQSENKEGVTKVGKKAEANNAPEDYKEKCAKLKADLETLSDKAGRIKIQDEKGEVRTMSEEDRVKRLDSTQRQIKGFCE